MSRKKKQHKRAAHSKDAARGAALKSRVALATSTPKPAVAPTGVTMRLDMPMGKTASTREAVAESKKSWWGKLISRLRRRQ